MKRSLTPSSLGLAQGKSPMNDEEIEEQAKRLYHDTGSVLLNHTHLAKLPYSVRKTVEEIAAQLFGQRKQK
jgi:hypothetical protein